MINSQIPKTDIPSTIKTRLLELVAKGQELESLRTKLRLEEARIAVAVSDEKNEDGKPLFGNEKARDAETIRRSQESDSCAALRSNIFAAEYERAAISADIDELKMNFKIYQFDRELEIAILKGSEQGREVVG